MHDKLNVVLLTVDSLRADHLGCYGYPRPTSPFLDAFAQTGALAARFFGPPPPPPPPPTPPTPPCSPASSPPPTTSWPTAAAPSWRARRPTWPSSSCRPATPPAAWTTCGASASG